MNRTTDDTEGVVVGPRRVRTEEDGLSLPVPSRRDPADQIQYTRNPEDTKPYSQGDISGAGPSPVS